MSKVFKHFTWLFRAIIPLTLKIFPRLKSLKLMVTNFWYQLKWTCAIEKFISNFRCKDLRQFELESLDHSFDFTKHHLPILNWVTQEFRLKNWFVSKSLLKSIFENWQAKKISLVNWDLTLGADLEINPNLSYTFTSLDISGTKVEGKLLINDYDLMELIAKEFSKTCLKDTLVQIISDIGPRIDFDIDNLFSALEFKTTFA